MNLLTYLVYRAELDADRNLVVQPDGSVWKLVAQASGGSQVTAYRDSAVLQFTDDGVEYGKRYLWRVTSRDQLGNESLALAQPGVTLRRHLGAASLSGTVQLGFLPEGGTTVSWVYTLDPLAADGVAQFSARWKPLADAAQLIPELEQLYDLLVLDNRPPTAPVAAALAHGGDGREHLEQAQVGPVFKDGVTLDTFSFPEGWRSWQSNFGQNYPESFYRTAGAEATWRAELALPADGTVPAAGDALVFWDLVLTFADEGFGPGTNKIQRCADADAPRQLSAIALALNTAALPLRAWADTARGCVVVETVGSVAAPPQAQAQNLYQPVGTPHITVTLTKTLAYKTQTDEGATDTDLTPYGEGSGQGFFRQYGDVALGHLHLRVDWNDRAAERGGRFARGAVLVNGRFVADYVPGASESGVVDYLVASDPAAGFTLAANGMASTVVEIRKYHPSGTYSAAALVKTCPNRTAVRRDQAQRLVNEVELDLAYNPWDGTIDLSQCLDAAWNDDHVAGWRPRFITHELYAAADAFSDAGTALPPTDYLAGSAPQRDLPSSLTLPEGLMRLDTGTLSQPLLEEPLTPLANLPLLLLTDRLRQVLTEPGMALAQAGALWRRAALLDGWGLTTDGLFPADGSCPGNMSLWSVPQPIPAVETFTWLVEAKGTETYIVDPAADDPDSRPDPVAQRSGPTLATRPWRAVSQGSMVGWRQVPQDESQSVQMAIGTWHLAGSMPAGSARAVPRLHSSFDRRPSRATLSVRVESLSCRDYGDAPLLANGQGCGGDSGPYRHEVATFLPRVLECSTPFQVLLQPVLTDAHVASTGQASAPPEALELELESGTYNIYYGSGYLWRASHDDSRPVFLNLNMQVEGRGKTCLLSKSFVSMAGLLRSLDEGRFAPALAQFSFGDTGRIRFWCEMSGADVHSCLSLKVVGEGQRRAALERPQLPYTISDFLNWDDADGPQGRPLSGAAREWPDGEDPYFPAGGAQWHDADYADTVPAGAYPLSPERILPAKDGYEVALVAHAMRPELGHTIQLSDTEAAVASTSQVNEAKAGQPLTLWLPPLVPVAPQDFSREVAGWGLGSGLIMSSDISGVLDPRIGPGGSCRGLITSSGQLIRSSLLRPGETAFSRIVVGSPQSDFRVYWQLANGSWQPLPPLIPVSQGLRSGNELWVTDTILPLAAPRRLAVGFDIVAPTFRFLYGVWLVEETPQWRVKATKDGAPFSEATGSEDWVDTTRLSSRALPLRRASLHSLRLDGSLPAGDYTFFLEALTYNAASSQTSGNYLYHELADGDGLAETNQGAQVQIKVRIS